MARDVAVVTNTPLVKVTSPMIFTPGTNLTGPFTMRLLASIRLGMPSVRDCGNAIQRGWEHHVSWGLKPIPYASMRAECRAGMGTVRPAPLRMH